MASTNKRIFSDNFDFLFNHIVFPPKLPQTEEIAEWRGELAMIDFIHSAITGFKSFDGADADAWNIALDMVSTLKEIQLEDLLSEEAISSALANIQDREVVAMHLKAQNAGVLFRKDGEHHVIVDVFEASAKNEDVMGTTGRLIRTFPGCSVRLKREICTEASLLAEITTFLRRANEEIIAECMPKTKKAGSTQIEIRDTASPALMTECFMTMLAALGEPWHTGAMQKNTRDEVNWSDSKGSWRRSPFWLVMRVSIHAALRQRVSADLAWSQYKNFMLYLVGQLGELALETNAPPEICKIISNKIACRSRKLSSCLLEAISMSIIPVLDNLRGSIQKAWRDLTESCRKDIPLIDPKALIDDTSLSLQNSRAYLGIVLAGENVSSQEAKPQNSEKGRMPLTRTRLPEFQSFCHGDDTLVALGDLESWVRDDLHYWLKEIQPTEKHCSALASLFRDYSACAQQQYTCCPRERSLMLLILLELWMALDLLILKLIPLLGQYSPEIPQDLMQPLLLPHLEQQERLVRCEKYLEQRHMDARSDQSKILANPCVDSFAVKYFNTSPKHQQIRLAVECDAQAQRDAKKAEWRTKTDRHNHLLRSYQELEHSFDYNEKGVQYHCAACAKCKCKKEADRMTIDIHEWPLPNTDWRAKTVIFEIDCPESFVAWRDTTWYLLHELGRDGASPATDVKQQLLSYGQLSSRVVNRGQRVSMASYTKSFGVAHYRSHNFPVSLDGICVNNALKFRYFDLNSSVWVAGQEKKPSFRSKCSIRIPEGPYRGLQYAVDGCSHTTNEVLAKQSECSKDLSLHEYYAFGVLRAGERLQWLNVLRELASANLTFNNQAVSGLIAQAAWQAGSPHESSARRVTHQFMEDELLCRRMLELLESWHDRIETNWNEQQTMFLLVVLGLRTLSLSGSSAIVQRTIRLLRRIRRTTLRWCREIVKRLSSVDHGQDCEKYQRLILISVSSCLRTFDVEPLRLKDVLLEDEDIATFVESAIIFHDNTPSSKSSVSSIQGHVLRVKKILHETENLIRSLICARDAAMNLAISHIWTGAAFDRSWTIMQSPNDRLATNETAASAGNRRRTVTFNVLSGELLVNGLPLSKIPSQFSKQDLFKRTFGKRILSVLSSNMPGMMYMSVCQVEGYQIHVGNRDGKVVIRAKHELNEFEILPHNIFQDDFPTFLSRDHSHWMDLKSGKVEFRPLSSQWKSSPKNWTLHFSKDDPSRMYNLRVSVIDIRSLTNDRICDALAPLEFKRNIISIRYPDGNVEAKLPRYDLSFSLNDIGQLYSRELNAFVDPNQDLGTLYGLENKLVLQDEKSTLETRRSVLVPIGDVQVTRKDSHVRVSIDAASKTQVKFLRFQQDTYLSKLRGPTFRFSALYQAYLHALTSSVLKDPFTERTGTDEALRILREESILSSVPLTKDELAMLENISNLTPRREFYPDHLRVMQQTMWSPELGQLVQSDDFKILVDRIVDHSCMFSFLYEPPVQSRTSKRHDSHLHARARFRNRFPQNSGSHPPPGNDVAYHGRDGFVINKRALSIYEFASLANIWPSTLDISMNLQKDMLSWGSVGGFGQDPIFSTLQELIDLNLAEKWGALYEWCQRISQFSSHKLMFLFCTATFGKPQHLSLFKSLLAVAVHDGFPRLSLRPNSTFQLSLGINLSIVELEQLIRQHCRPCPGNPPSPHLSKSARAARRRAQISDHEQQKNEQVDRCVQDLRRQWPCDSPVFNTSKSVPVIYASEASRACNVKFATWNRNRLFLQHVSEVQTHLNRVHVSRAVVSWPAQPQEDPRPRNISERADFPSIIQLLLQTPPPQVEFCRESLVTTKPETSQKRLEPHSELEELISCLRSVSSRVREEYAADLEIGLKALELENELKMPSSIPLFDHDLETHCIQAKAQVDSILDLLQSALAPQGKVSKIIQAAGLWPVVNLETILACLSSKVVKLIGQQWKESIVKLGLEITTLQRAYRMLRLRQKNIVTGFFKESENLGHEGWSAMEYPDWLLMEVEGDFMIRSIQAKVALEMLAPQSEKNTVLQLNMGEGKSSVILPMVAVASANGKDLSRVVVLKPLLKQSERQLLERVGGMVDRRICHIPISRRTRIDGSSVSQLQKIYEACRAEGGILIALPEHILSFRLMGREMVFKDPNLAGGLIALDFWLRENCRDILDESDELLNPHFQLVYTIGKQSTIDGSSKRWKIIQNVLSLVGTHVLQSSQSFPDRIEIEQKDGAFPVLRILDKSISDVFINAVLQRIVQEGLADLIPLSRGNINLVILVDFIRDLASVKGLDEANEAFTGDEVKILLLLRGLFAHGVLLFALTQKRWLVEYGLAPDRCMMAVPYRAKGVPSTNSEFGHPDLAILLTCLSYYYSGLSDPQITECFEILFKADDPSSEYLSWTQTMQSMPTSLRYLNAVNLKDETFCKSILFPRLRYCKSVVDFYLSNKVFPREAKEFDNKLSTSAWDLPAGIAQLCTGFSGTNDNKRLLPLTIQQNDLSGLRHTNAMVLSTLLRDENRQYLVAKDAHGKGLNVPGLLALLPSLKLEVQVLIDVGAQVLDMTNREVVDEWLKQVRDKKAAVFFDENDEIQVVDRQGRVDRFAISPFAKRLDECLVYLDEVHTRGVDISLPVGARAAVTLGPRLTKDKLVQGCMRMRKLGYGQSLITVAPPEVDAEVAKGACGRAPDIKDVIRWAVEQTCHATESLTPLWIAQGLEFCERSDAIQTLLADKDVKTALLEEDRREQFNRQIQEPEARLLCDMYGPRSGQTFRSRLHALQHPFAQRLKDVAASISESARKDSEKHEEQEREVAPEVERQLEIQRPGSMEPLPPTLHADVLFFARHGCFRDLTPSDAFRLAFESLQSTSVSGLLEAPFPSQELYVTADYARAVQLPIGGHNDEYLRPVHWIITTKLAAQAIIISPHEANELIREIENSQCTRLHVYAAKTSKAMQSFEDLCFYTIRNAISEQPPPIPRVLLPFAGSLYFDTFAQYQRLCRFLGVIGGEPPEGAAGAVRRDGFVPPQNRALLKWGAESPFNKSPLLFLNALLTLRRKGQDYSRTPMGALLSGKPVLEASFAHVGLTQPPPLLLLTCADSAL